MTLNFHKMHGLGNDFVIIDARGGAVTLTQDDIRHIADRRLGVGCDQLIVLDPPRSDAADCFMHIYNPDGSQAGACGNGTRCVAALLGGDHAVIETVSGYLKCRRISADMIEVDMGEPQLDWDKIPLSEARDTLNLGIGDGNTLTNPVAVSMGNPHCVFFVTGVEKLPIETLGPAVERNALFPARTNVEFAEIIGPSCIRMRVWERGAGVTMACGSGACATLVAAVRRGLAGRRADIVLDGGVLSIEWRESDNHVLMSGPVAHIFDGTLKPL